MYQKQPKYGINSCFLKPVNIKMGRSPLFIVESAKEYPKGWLYTAYYPETQEYRRYYEDKIDRDYQLLEDQEMPAILYGKVSLLD